MPFATAATDHLVVSTTDLQVTAYWGDPLEFAWSRALNESVVGVGVSNDMVVAADQKGGVYWFDRRSGEPRGMLECKVAATALAVAAAGDWALVHTAGIITGRHDQVTHLLDLAGVSHAAFNRAGNRLLCGSSLGEVHLVRVDSGKFQSATLSAAVSGVAWFEPDAWLVATPYEVFRLNADLSRPKLFLAREDDYLSDPGTSADGKLLAFRAGDKQVLLFDRQANELGRLDYGNVRIGQIEFAAGACLGIGLGRHLAHQVDLLSGDVRLAPGPPDERLTPVDVAVQVDPARVREALERPEKPEAKTPRFAGRWPSRRLLMAEAGLAVVLFIMVWTLPAGWRSTVALCGVGLVMGLMPMVWPKHQPRRAR